MDRATLIVTAAERLARAHHGKDASLKRHPGVGEHETEEGRLDWRRALAEFDSAVTELVAAVGGCDSETCPRCDGVGRVMTRVTQTSTNGAALSESDPR